MIILFVKKVSGVIAVANMISSTLETLPELQKMDIGAEARRGE